MTVPTGRIELEPGPAWACILAPVASHTRSLNRTLLEIGGIAMLRHDDVVRSNSRELPGRFEYNAFSKDLELAPQRKLAEVIEMTPEEMANASRLVTCAYNELLSVAASLEDAEYRRLMTECSPPRLPSSKCTRATRTGAASLMRW